MAKILGLDLGTASIGWAVIETNKQGAPEKIFGMGSRVVPVDAALANNFSRGKDCSVNANRTSKRSSRRMNHRFKLRRDLLLREFEALGVDKTSACAPKNALEKWKLRAEAASKQISLAALAEVLLHINSRRGYKASKEDLDPSNKDSRGYVKDVRDRALLLYEEGLTPGEFFYKRLLENPNFRVKGEVLPRNAYFEEAKKILDCQSKFYPETLTPEARSRILDYIIFYQRPLRSCKHLVSDCELERRVIIVDGKEKEVGPKVAHVSNPLSQVSRIWQLLNNVFFTKDDERLIPTLDQKELMAQQLLLGNDLKVTAIKQLCGLKPTDRKWRISENAAKGIKGNSTRKILSDILGNKYRGLLNFGLQFTEKTDEATGEILRVEVSSDVINQPLYKLWHAIYSIDSIDDLRAALQNQFGIAEDDILDKLCSIDFAKQAYGNLSAKALRKILPYLMQGIVYSEACLMAGYNHSRSLTKEENESRTLDDAIQLIPKGAMRQPVVEKILNQMINVVNSLMSKFGRFDSIHVEMARELKMGKDERDSMALGISKNEKLNDEMRKRIHDEYGLYPTLTRVTKMKLWEESKHECIYCGARVGIAQFLQGINWEVEHIIPKSLLFDDSFANKACACRKCNQEKGQMTAIDYMRTQPEAMLIAYKERIAALRDEKKLSGQKYKYLLMPKSEIPEDFIARDLKETQYISKKALEMLRQVCRDVMATSGRVTDYMRRQWGWDTLLHEIDMPMYRQAGLTETIVKDANSQPVERIKGWSKRLDHRHHALDALAIASTSRSVVNRLNHLNALPDAAPTGVKAEKRSRLEVCVQTMPHFMRQTVAEALAGIAVSFKPKSKLTTPGKVIKHTGAGRKCVQTGVLIPRGPLHKDTVFGKIKQYDSKGQLQEKAVVRYKLTDITNEKSASSIVDAHIRQLVIDRLREYKGDAKKAYSVPLYSDKAGTQQIKSVRCFTGGTGLIGIRKDSEGREIGFVAPGSNHHVALYVDKTGEIVENVVTFAHSVQRRLHGIPAVVKDPTNLWSEILQGKEPYDEEFLRQLPEDGLAYWMHLQINEMFVLGLDDATFSHAIETNDKRTLAEHLYRVQKLSSMAYQFAYHTVTASKPEHFVAEDRRFRLVKSIGKLKALNPKKVMVTNLGEIKPV